MIEFFFQIVRVEGDLNHFHCSGKIRTVFAPSKYVPDERSAAWAWLLYQLDEAGTYRVQLSFPNSRTEQKTVEVSVTYEGTILRRSSAGQLVGDHE